MSRAHALSLSQRASGSTSPDDLADRLFDVSAVLVSLQALLGETVAPAGFAADATGNLQRLCRLAQQEVYAIGTQVADLSDLPAARMPAPRAAARKRSRAPA